MKLNKRKGYLEYLNLSPISNAEDIEEYSENLKYCLDNDDILNIAISGPYGSGKSSFINTFFSKNKQYNPIWISLGEYGNKKNIKITNEYYHSIEKSIIQQLLYQVDESVLPLSRFKRINAYSKSKLYFSTVAALIFILVLVELFFPNIITMIFNNYLNIVQLLSSILGLGSINTIILSFSILLFLTICFYKVVEYFKNNISIRKFKVKDVEIEVVNNYESIFNKYLDELVYFFQESGYNIVIIEDLDRLHNATIIIQKLKELNQIINSSTRIKFNIKFIYAVKDNLFTNSKERTKFFDKIIPIIPISSFFSSNEIIWNMLCKIYELDENDTFDNIDKDFINDIAIYVDEMRIINNVISEFVIYNDMIKIDDLNNKTLFSIVLYKNLYPSEYNKLLNKQGAIVNAFDNINTNLKKVINKIENDITSLKNELINIDNEFFVSVSELKHSLFSMVLNSNKEPEYQYFKFNNSKVDNKAFFNDNFDIMRFHNEIVTFYNCNTTKTENEVFKKFEGKDKFLERLDNLFEGKNKRIKEIQNDIDKKTKDIINIKLLPLDKLIQEYGIDNFVDENANDLEKFLLRRGYITNDYQDYITVFREGNLKSNDMRFIKCVKKQKALPYSYELNKLKNIVSRLSMIDYESIEILNINLIDYLYDNKKDYFDKIDKILFLFKEINDTKFNFIIEYENTGKNFEEFSNDMINISNNFWGFMYTKKKNDCDYIDKWIIRYLKLNELKSKIDIDFIKYINNSDSFFEIQGKYFLNIVNNLNDIGVKFKNLIKIDSQTLNIIYNYNLYQLNITMISTILELFDIKFEDIKNELITTIFSNKNLYSMQEYIINNFSDFMNECYIKLKEYNDDVNIIIELLNNKNIGIKDKEILIKTENIVINNLEKLTNEVQNFVINNEKMENNILNLLYIYSNEGFTDRIIKMINSDKINFGKINNYSNKDILFDFKKDFINNDEIQLKIYIKTIENFNVSLYDEESDIKYSDIINSNVSMDKKIKYLNIIKNDITIERLCNCINMLGENYKKIASEFGGQAIIDYSKEMLKILNILQYNKKISSYKIEKNNKIRVFNKKVKNKSIAY